MRKTLLILLVLIVVLLAAAGAYVFAGHRLVLLVDRFKTVPLSNGSFKTLSYEGDGNGGVLRLDDTTLSLNETAEGVEQPHVGTTKDGELALSYAGHVFAFGRSPANTDALAVQVGQDDQVWIELRRSLLSWPTFFEVNFMTGNSALWKRNRYQHLVWNKPNGAELEMWWRYEQCCYRRDGWVDGFLTNPGLTGLIRVSIRGNNKS